MGGATARRGPPPAPCRSRRAASRADVARSSLDSVPDLAEPQVGDADVWALTSETYGASPADAVVDPVRTAEMPTSSPAAPAAGQAGSGSAPSRCAASWPRSSPWPASFTTALEITSDTALVPTDTAPARLPHRHVDARRPRRQPVDRDPDRGRAARRSAASAPDSAGGGVPGWPVAPAWRSPGSWRWRSASPSSRSTPPATSRRSPTRSSSRSRSPATSATGCCSRRRRSGSIVFFASINDAFGDRRSGPQPVDRRARRAGHGRRRARADDPGGDRRSSATTGTCIEGPGRAVGAARRSGGSCSWRCWRSPASPGTCASGGGGWRVAIGGALPIVWLAASTLFDLTDTPGRPGVRATRAPTRSSCTA